MLTGNLHYSDSLPANAGVHGYDVINAQGVLVKRVEPAMTADEKAVAKEEAKQDKAQKEAANASRAMINSCWPRIRPKQTFARRRSSRSEMIDLQIKSVQTGLHSLERSLTELLQVGLLDLERNETCRARSVDQPDQRPAQEGRFAIRAARTHKTEREKALQGFGAELIHYRELQEKYKQH